MKIHKGDTVQIMIGKDKGRKGKVDKVFPRRNLVVVEGINQYKRHVKSRAEGQKSEIVIITKPIHVSKVAMLDPKSKKPTRIGYKITNKEKIRISRKTGGKI